MMRMVRCTIFRLPFSHSIISTIWSAGIQRRWCASAGTDVSGSGEANARPSPAPQDFTDFVEIVAGKLFDDEEKREMAVAKLWCDMEAFIKTRGLDTKKKGLPQDSTDTPTDTSTDTPKEDKARETSASTGRLKDSNVVTDAEEKAWAEINKESFWSREDGFLAFTKLLSPGTGFLLQFEGCSLFIQRNDKNLPPFRLEIVGRRNYPLDKDVILEAVREIRCGQTPVPNDIKYPFTGLLNDPMNKYISNGLAFTGKPASASIEDPNRRTITVVSGPSGSGKTTLCEHHLPQMWRARLVVYFTAKEINSCFDEDCYLDVIKNSEEELQRAAAGWACRHYHEDDPYFLWAAAALDTVPKDRRLHLRATRPAEILVNCIGRSNLPSEWKTWWNSPLPSRLNETMVVIVDEIGPYLTLARGLISSLRAFYGNDTVLKRVRRVELVLCGTGLELLEDKNELGCITSDPRKISRVRLTGPNEVFLSEALKTVTPDYGEEVTPMFCNAIKKSELFRAITRNARLLVLACHYLRMSWSVTQEMEQLDAEMAHRNTVLRDNAIAHSLGVDGHVELALLEYPKHNGLSRIDDSWATKQRIVDAALVEMLERVLPIENTDVEKFLRRRLGPKVKICKVDDPLLKHLGDSIEKYHKVLHRCKLFIEEPENSKRKVIKGEIEELFVCLECADGMLIMEPLYPVRTVVPVYKSPTHDADLRKACHLGLLEYDSNEAPVATTAVATFAFGAPRLSLDGYELESFTARWVARLVALQRGAPPRLVKLPWQLPATQPNGGPTVKEYDEVRRLLQEARALVLLNGPSAPGPDVILLELPQHGTQLPDNAVARITFISNKRTELMIVPQCMDMGCVCLQPLKTLVEQRMVELVSEELMSMLKLPEDPKLTQKITTTASDMCESQTEEQCTKALASLLEQLKNTDMDITPKKLSAVMNEPKVKQLRSLLKDIKKAREYRRASLLTLALMCVDGELEGCHTLQDLDDRVAALCQGKKIIVTACLVSGGSGKEDREGPDVPGWEKCLLSWEKHPWVQSGGIRRCPAISFGPLKSLVETTAGVKDGDCYLYFGGK